MVKAQCASDPAAGETALRAVRKSPALSSVTSSVTSHENVEIQLYLSKLKELVPHMPRNRKVSKLEVIQHVIDYISDLQMALESRPRHQVAASSGAAAVASLMAGASSPRQPLGLLPANPNAAATCAAQEVRICIFVTVCALNLH